MLLLHQNVLLHPHRRTGRQGEPHEQHRFETASHAFLIQISHQDRTRLGANLELQIRHGAHQPDIDVN